ncbi:hypothetical protein BKP35_10030 [Anaerobacillus arseniciselenatis]|uniref:DUF2179 domain-containing protein n=1 Tax=Anaerobacillus arseniciselenatis TaxID=85682 RepID=A0A1S2LLC9_9BACI|nr:YitT family protein [Anaerobacillus arseniciselenatis]OIJ12893.1 hypothetical protein BKP35_10030 [Anaerobacillus arseniciselenatis]
MRETIKSYMFLNLGALFVAINVHFFLSPNTLATGGVSGLAIILNSLIPGLTIGLFMIFVNIILFIVGFIFIGFKFGVKTIYASFALSFLVWFLEWLVPMSGPISDDLLIQLIIGQCISAVGIGLVFSKGASTGGTDIIAMILNKYFAIEMGKAVLLADIFIALSSIFLFGPEIGMYAFFGVMLNALVIDYTLKQVNEKKEVVIISAESDSIKKYIVKELEIGATIHDARGAFTDSQKEVITTIIGRKDLIKLKRYISEVDQQAFITVHDMNEILGQRYKRLA